MNVSEREEADIRRKVEDHRSFMKHSFRLGGGSRSGRPRPSHSPGNCAGALPPVEKRGLAGESASVINTTYGCCSAVPMLNEQVGEIVADTAAEIVAGAAAREEVELKLIVPADMLGRLR